jgi:hypothetical protein
MNRFLRGTVFLMVISLPPDALQGSGPVVANLVVFFLAKQMKQGCFQEWLASFPSRPQPAG